VPNSGPRLTRKRAKDGKRGEERKGRKEGRKEGKKLEGGGRRGREERKKS